MTGLDFFDAAPGSLAILTGGLLGLIVIATLLYAASSRLLTAIAQERWPEKVNTLRRRLRRVSALTTVLSASLYLGGGLFLLATGADLAEVGRGLADPLPQGWWVQLAKTTFQLFALFLVTVALSRLMVRLSDAAAQWADNYEKLQANDKSLERFFASVRKLITRGTTLVALVLAFQLIELPRGAVDLALIGLRIYFLVAGGRILWQAVDAVVATVDALSEKYAQSRELSRYYERLRPLIPLLRRTLEYLIYLTVASLAALQIEPIAPLADWGSRLMRLLGLFFLTRVLLELAKLLMEELLTRGQHDPAQRQRRLTLVPLVRSFLQYAVYSVFVIIALSELGIDPSPLLAGAGIVGLAVGFGAQSLIQDMVAGLFVLFEEYYLVGDYIQACEARGVVESVDLRTTRIRDEEGRLHILRNGEVGNIVNYSKEFTCAVVEIGVAYGSDLGLVTEVLEKVGEQLQHDLPDVVLRPTSVQGVEVYAESSVILRTVTRVRPGRHRGVERDLRRRIKEAFEQNGVEIAPTISLECMPFPSH